MHNLSAGCRQNIADLTALAVVLHLRPLGFTENQADMSAFAESIFKAGQSVPNGVFASPKSYLPSRCMVKAS